MKSFLIGCVLMLFPLLGSSAHTQTSDEVLDVQVIASVDRLVPGKTHPIALIVTIKPPYHINSVSPAEDYLVPTMVSFRERSDAVFAPPEFPSAETQYLAFSQAPLEVYSGRIRIFSSVTLSGEYVKKEYVVSGLIGYQACDNDACFPPAELVFEERIPVAEPGEATQPVHQAEFAERAEASDSGSAQQVETIGSGQIWRLGERNLLVTFLLVFLGGLGLNLTPCVYPLIPITIGYFGGQAAGKRGGVLAHAILYVLGMAATYSMLGVVASFTGSLFGAALQNPLVLLGIALVMLVLALSMFDLYEFRLPAFLTKLAGGRKKGYLGSLFMGLTVGFVAAPCIGPFILGLLTYVGEKGNIILGFLLFFVLALGLGIPLLFLAVFSGSIDRLPRSGAWMVWVRKIFGFVLVAMAAYFLQPLFPHTLSYHIALALILFLGGIFLAWVEPSRMPGKLFPLIRNLVGLVFLLLAWVLITSGIQAYVDGRLREARITSQPAVAIEEIQWLPGTETLLDEARSQGRPVFIDFYADWCVPCKEMDHSTFVDPEVVKLSREFTMLKVDLTGSQNPVNRRLKNRFSVRGVPTFVWIRPDGTEVFSVREVGFVGREKFLEIMETVLSEGR